jgi:signal transduction histidine kinase
MLPPAKTKTRAQLALLFSVPVAFSVLFFLVNQAAEHTDTRLVQIQTLESSVRTILSLTKDVEAGERGFLLTGDEQYLEPLNHTTAWLPGQMRLCLLYAEDLPMHKAAVQKIVRLAQQRFDAANKVLAAQREDGFRAALDQMKANNSESTMGQLRREVIVITGILNQQATETLDKQRVWNRSAFFIFLFGTLIMVVVLVRLYMALVSYMDSRDAAQIELQALNRDLESRIAERTLELEQSNAELQQFAYVASHDLQEPLRTITSFTQLLANRYRGQLDGDADEFIEYIVNASRRMTGLINGLLALARLRKSGNQSVPVPFEELLEEATMSLQASIRETGAQVEHGPLPCLMVDRLQFSQVFQNLLSNAIKYRREEEVPRVRVTASRVGTDWTFAVEDNARGFEQQYSERIFGLFQRLEGREVEGTGLGLSISRKIVERHGGRIWAESKPGHGSTFYFTLPTSLEAKISG